MWGARTRQGQGHLVQDERDEIDGRGVLHQRSRVLRE